jgi:hypothetical protein
MSDAHLNEIAFFLCIRHDNNRTPDGEMFVVKDPDRFATNVIPQVRVLRFFGSRANLCLWTLALMFACSLFVPPNSILTTTSFLVLPGSKYHRNRSVCQP